MLVQIRLTIFLRTLKGIYLWIFLKSHTGNKKISKYITNKQTNKNNYGKKWHPTGWNAFLKRAAD